ncbi:hypothetical protein BB050_03041 [Flavobacterium anhuiense]|uniref:Uncharacterized protein n=1 Tax=Flavobacterium anhuiense TaxID=459526 RepID=A0AAC9D3Q3_9FLAO|nr:hypothetical protein [Flavobacterium anhuiense]AOC96131.1 hypothetical protein BB050_03041 [Flavobacterium anhuiense]
MNQKYLNSNTRYIFLFLISVMTINCKKSETYINEYTLTETVKRSTKITIELHKKLETDSATTFPVVDKLCEVTNKNQILDFEKVFANGKRTDYCCCPDINYSINFYQNEEKEYFALYHVDTTQLKNKVRIFETGYQYSYIVDKNIWKKYLSKINESH